MTDYSQLSDFEINKRVAEVVYSIEVIADDFYAKDVPFAYHRDEQVFIFIDEPLSGAWRSYNPCKKPADAWPIIVGHKLSLINADDEWLCVPDDTVIDGVTGDDVQMIYSSGGHVHANPLRAAMIVFLMMQEKSK